MVFGWFRILECFWIGLLGLWRFKGLLPAPVSCSSEPTKIGFDYFQTFRSSMTSNIRFWLILFAVLFFVCLCFEGALPLRNNGAYVLLKKGGVGSMVCETNTKQQTLIVLCCLIHVGTYCVAI